MGSILSMDIVPQQEVKEERRGGKVSSLQALALKVISKNMNNCTPTPTQLVVYREERTKQLIELLCHNRCEDAEPFINSLPTTPDKIIVFDLFFTPSFETLAKNPITHYLFTQDNATKECMIQAIVEATESSKNNLDLRKTPPTLGSAVRNILFNMNVEAKDIAFNYISKNMTYDPRREELQKVFNLLVSESPVAMQMGLADLEKSLIRQQNPH
jgi:hypothetical protein